MSKSILIPEGKEAFIAEYSPQIISEYSGNPYLEALPPILSPQKVAKQLTEYPSYNKEERKLENYYRIHFVRRLFQVFQPLPYHIELESRISTTIRQGYLARNPLKQQYARNLQEGYSVIQSGDWLNGYKGNFRSSNLGFSIIGVSGIGKSTALNQILKYIPQVILHKEYHGIKFTGYQITYLKLDCPMDGSIKGLCIDFFIKIDNLIGTQYYRKFGTSRRSTDSMIATMSQVCQHLGIGLLLIDEIQNLSLAKSGGGEKMLNFFVSLNNNIGVPLIMVGTPKALEVLQRDFRLARRGDGGQGSIFWERLKEDKNWELFINGIWSFQWTKKQTTLTDEIKNIIYVESQGIVDIAVKLYAMSQIYAINNGKEEITPAVIRKVAQENLRLVKPMLESLRTGNIRNLARYDDICTDIDFGEFFVNNNHTAEVDFRIKALQKQKREEDKQVEVSFKEQALIKLIDLDFEAKKAEKAIESVLNENQDITSVQELIVKSIEIMSKKVKRRTTNQSNETIDNDDIRTIIKNGRNRKLTAYEALKENRIIKSVEDEIFMVG